MTANAQEPATPPASPGRRLAVIALFTAAIVVTVYETIPWSITTSRYVSERRNSIELLAAASSRAELEEAVGYLGVMLDLPGGEWIAIRYRDSHSLFDYSVAVALMSDGRWLESDYHFCGQFSGYRHSVEQLREAHEIGDAEVIAHFEDAFNRHAHKKRLRRIETECTLDEAVDELLAMHFWVRTR